MSGGDSNGVQYWSVHQHQNQGRNTRVTVRYELFKPRSSSWVLRGKVQHCSGVQPTWYLSETVFDDFTTKFHFKKETTGFPHVGPIQFTVLNRNWFNITFLHVCTIQCDDEAALRVL